MLNGSSTTWQEHEKYQLWLAYQVKTPLKILEQYFDRSTTAINKFLTRSGIRDAVKSAHANLEKQIQIKTVNELHILIIGAGLDEESVMLERRTTRSWMPSPKTKSCLEAIGIVGNSPWKPKNLEKKLPVNSEVGRASQKEEESCVDLETCCHYLIRHGISVRKLMTPNAFKWTHVVQNQRMTSLGLLRTANQLRLENKEPIFHIKGITCD